MKNPYPETIVDEASGVEVKNQKYTLWQEGYDTRVKEKTEEINTLLTECKEYHNAVIKKIKKELKGMICREFESPDGKP